MFSLASYICDCKNHGENRDRSIGIFCKFQRVEREERKNKNESRRIKQNCTKEDVPHSTMSEFDSPHLFSFFFFLGKHPSQAL